MSGNGKNPGPGFDTMDKDGDDKEGNQFYLDKNEKEWKFDIKGYASELEDGQWIRRWRGVKDKSRGLVWIKVVSEVQVHAMQLRIFSVLED